MRKLTLIATITMLSLASVSCSKEKSSTNSGAESMKSKSSVEISEEKEEETIVEETIVEETTEGTDNIVKEFLKGNVEFSVSQDFVDESCMDFTNLKKGNNYSYEGMLKTLYSDEYKDIKIEEAHWAKLEINAPENWYCLRVYGLDHGSGMVYFVFQEVEDKLLLHAVAENIERHESSVHKNGFINSDYYSMYGQYRSKYAPDADGNYKTLVESDCAFNTSCAYCFLNVDGSEEICQKLYDIITEMDFDNMVDPYVDYLCIESEYVGEEIFYHIDCVDEYYEKKIRDVLAECGYVHSTQEETEEARRAYAKKNQIDEKYIDEVYKYYDYEYPDFEEIDLEEIN